MKTSQISVSCVLSYADVQSVAAPPEIADLPPPLAAVMNLYSTRPIVID